LNNPYEQVKVHNSNKKFTSVGFFILNPCNSYNTEAKSNDARKTQKVIFQSLIPSDGDSLFTFLI